AAVDGEVVDPRCLPDAGEVRRRRGRDGGPGEVAQLRQGAGLDVAARADDRHGVTELLDLREDVAGEQDGASPVPQPADLLGEDGLHEGVQAGGRLVKEVELDV